MLHPEPTFPSGFNNSVQPHSQASTPSLTPRPPPPASLPDLHPLLLLGWVDIILGSLLLLGGRVAVLLSQITHVVIQHSIVATDWTWFPYAAMKHTSLHLLLPDCIRFSCCSPIVSTSAAAPRLHLLISSQCNSLASGSCRSALYQVH